MVKPVAALLLLAGSLAASHYEILWDGEMCTFSQKSGDRQITRKNLQNGQCRYRISTGRVCLLAGLANAQEAWYDGAFLIFVPEKKRETGRSEFFCREAE